MAERMEKEHERGLKISEITPFPLLEIPHLILLNNFSPVLEVSLKLSYMYVNPPPF